MKVLLTGGCGYIGTELASFLKLFHKVVTVDIRLFGSENDPDIAGNYKDLPAEYVNEFDCIIHLAGHSSVPFCDYDVEGSLKNNCLEFMNFVSRIDKRIPILYASSASVYGNTHHLLAKERDVLRSPLKVYDTQKQIIDRFMIARGGTYFGLRFGTVCGFSLMPRNELLINAMVKSVFEHRIVKVTSATNYRAVLSMLDLENAIKTILDHLDREPGVYNLASFNETLDNIGGRVAEFYDVECELDFNRTTPYSFSLDTTKFQKEFKFNFSDDLEKIAALASANYFNVERNWCIKF